MLDHNRKWFQNKNVCVPVLTMLGIILILLQCLTMLSVVAFAEKEILVSPEKLGQLVCALLGNSDVPEAMSKFGEVKYNATAKEREWEVEGKLFSIKYGFDIGENGQELFRFRLFANENAGPIFRSADQAEQWFSRLGLQVIREKEAFSPGDSDEKIMVGAFPRRGKKNSFDWNAYVWMRKSSHLHVKWWAPEYASPNNRFCQAFPVGGK